MSIHSRIREAIEAFGPDEPDVWSDAHFDALARAVFRHQFEHIAPYRAFCQRRGVEPDAVAHYVDIPAVPTDVFKRVRLSTTSQPERTFRTSGTTQGERGEHHFATLDLYRAAIFEPFRRYCLPDVDRMRMLALVPPPDEVPDSSLSFMVGELMARFGAAGSEYFVRRDAFAFDALEEVLDEVDEPVMLLGTAFAFVELFEHSARNWTLPAGSRVMETGGFKGRSRELEREELYELFHARLAVPSERALSEYSMTELSSQAYTDNLARAVPRRDGRFRVPPWVRIAIVDPLTLEVVHEPGQRGLIRWYDLANVDSVVAVQTSDLGVLDENGGLELFGRAAGAELRGCSLAIEEIVESQNDSD